MGRVIVMGFLQIREGDLPRLQSTFDEFTTVTRAQPGCEHYSLSTDVKDPNVIRVVEIWTDRASQSMHLVGDHMVTFNLNMRRGKILKAAVDAYDSDGSVRKLIYM